jgi:sulfate transport system permease protein
MPSRSGSILPGLPLSLGITLLYLSLVVMLPIGALLFKSFELGWDQFLHLIGGPRAVASYQLTLLAALAATAFNAVYGLLMAWILARYDFPGRRLLDAVMDLPFALPTAVAGIALTAAFAPNGPLGHLLVPLGIKVAYAPLGVILAMAFTSIPFVVRTVQPIIEHLEPELEEAARTLGARPFQTFCRVVFPAIFPAYLTGCSMAFARCLGEFGAIIFIAGNLPFKTEITSLLIYIRLEEYDYAGAAAIASVVLVAAFVMLLITNLVQARALRFTARG